MKQSTKSTLQRIIKEEIARQTGKRRLHEVAGAKFKVGDVVIALDGDESEQTIAVVYPNVALALAAAITDKEANMADQLADSFFSGQIKADEICYKMKESGYYYPESDLEPATMSERKMRRR